MQLAFVGLGAVVESAWLPAITQFAGHHPQPLGFDCDPARQLSGVTPFATLDTLLACPIDTLVIATSSLSHLPVLETVLSTHIPRIVVEKPVVASLLQMAALHHLLKPQAMQDRVLAFDHWMARTSIAGLINGQLDSGWQGPALPPPGSLSGDITGIDGFLEEPSGTGPDGDPVALNFATGEPDKRQFHHPDGVIMDTGPHVLAMIRENLVQLGLQERFTLHQCSATDRRGNPLIRGDISTAEGSAMISGEYGRIPLTITLNKYAGPGISRKGMQIRLREGAVVSADYRPEGDVLTLTQHGQRLQWVRPGALYPHCVRQLLCNPPARPGEYTRRRVEEISTLLALHQQLRGPH